MTPPVRIYQLDSPKYITGVVLWLCSSHLAKRLKAGWTKTGAKRPPHELSCDDCRREAA